MKFFTFILACAFTQSASSETVVINCPVIKNQLIKILEKPSGPLAPPVEFTKIELAGYKPTGIKTTIGGISNLRNDTSNEFGKLLTNKSLAEFKKLPRLHSISIDYNKLITDEGLKELVNCKEVTSIAMRDTNITDKGLEHVAKMNKVHTLYLGGSKITDRGIKFLADSKLFERAARQSERYRWGQFKAQPLLSVSGKTITDKCLPDIVSLFTFCDKHAFKPQIRFFKTAITDTGLEALRKALPKCEVYNYEGSN